VVVVVVGGGVVDANSRAKTTPNFL